jgi:hypothetical protein
VRWQAQKEAISEAMKKFEHLLWKQQLRQTCRSAGLGNRDGKNMKNRSPAIASAVTQKRPLVIT